MPWQWPTAGRLLVRCAGERNRDSCWLGSGRTDHELGHETGNLDLVELTERIEGFVYLMQQAFVHEFQANPQLGESGTTFTSAYFVSSFAAMAQIGDSPCFLCAMARCGVMSVDHTIEQEFISAGVAPEIAGKFRT